MIIRLNVTDPAPRRRKGKAKRGRPSTKLVFQVPERSRQEELLIELLDSNGITYRKERRSAARAKRRAHVNGAKYKGGGR